MTPFRPPPGPAAAAGAPAGAGQGGRRGYAPGVSVHSRTAGVGQQAPDFTLTDQDGEPFHLAGALATGPVVLVFLRGFG